MTAATALAGIALTAAIAPAGTGVGIQAGPVCLGQPALPGHAYPLGTVYVTNTGTSAEPVSFRVQQLPRIDHGQPVPPSWLSFGYPRLLWVIGQDHIQLAAGTGAYIAATLTVPAGARPGQYATEIIATTAGGGGGSGASAVLGAAAAVPLRFGIGATPPPAACDLPGTPTPPPGSDIILTPDAGNPLPGFLRARAVLLILAAIAVTVLAVLARRSR